MQGWLFALILSSVITVLSVITEKNNKKLNLFAAKTFLISFVSIYCGWTFLISEATYSKVKNDSCDILQSDK